MIFSSIKLYFYYTILFALAIFLILQFSDHQTINALIPQPGNMSLLNDTSVVLSDPTIKIETFATGLKEPTNMAFLNSGDALVLEKQNGTVRRIINGSVMHEPVLDVNVANYDTRGMLGIAVIRNETVGKQYVFLYYTQAQDGQADGQDRCTSPSKCIAGYLPDGNKLYRFELSHNSSKLINPNLIFSWPPFKRADHNGGELIVGSGNNLFLTVGHGSKGTSLVTNNKEKPREIDGDSGILTFNQNGDAVFRNGIIGNEIQRTVLRLVTKLTL